MSQAAMLGLKYISMFRDREMIEQTAEKPHRMRARTVALFLTERLKRRGKRHLKRRWMETVRMKCMLAIVLIVTVFAEKKHSTFPRTHLKWNCYQCMLI